MKKYIDFLVVPQDQQPLLNFRLSAVTVKLIIFFFALWTIVLIGTTIFYGKLSTQAIKAGVLKNENVKLREYNARVVEIEKSFRKNQELVTKIARLAGVELDDLNVSLSSLSDSVRVDSAGRIIVTGIAGDKIPLSEEELEKARIPQGRPLYGWITRGFIDEEGKKKHKGVDIAVKEGTPIVVTATGVVDFVGWDKNFGNLIVVDHENGYKTVYGHNQLMLVNKGEKVYKGDVIALSGNTGLSSAPHLHYEILKDDVAIDPAQYID